MGPISLGPTGNAQGGHWFFSLTSGCHVICHCWTALPMPQEVILCVTQIGHAHGMPSHITYANRQGNEISDHPEDFFDDDDTASSKSDDDTYMEDVSHPYSDDDGSSISDDKTTSSDDDNDDDPHGDPHLPPNGMPDPVVPDPAGPFLPVDPDDEEDKDDDDDNRPPHTDENAEHIPIIDSIEGSSAVINECESDNSSDAMSLEPPTTESEQFKAAEASGRAMANSNDSE